MRIKHFAINVEKNRFRRNRILDQARRQNIALNIFNAITPETLAVVPNSYTPERARLHWGRALLPTELACGLSHLVLWRNLLDDPEYDAYLILEDDATIQDGFSEILSSIEWNGVDFLKLSGQHPRPQKLLQRVNRAHSLYLLAYGPLDASGYIVTKKAAAKLTKYCDTMHMAIDVLIDRSYEYGLKMHAIQPYPIVSLQCDDPENPLFTDIGIRRQKYDVQNTIGNKVQYRFLRFRSSVLKRISEIRVFLS